VPAAAVIPAPKVYTKAVAVKTLVVGSYTPGIPKFKGESAKLLIAM
jgi:hypothetical protein